MELAWPAIFCIPTFCPPSMSGILKAWILYSCTAWWKYPDQLYTVYLLFAHSVCQGFWKLESCILVLVDGTSLTSYILYTYFLPTLYDRAFKSLDLVFLYRLMELAWPAINSKFFNPKCYNIQLNTIHQFVTFCWPCISVYLSQYLTNLMHKICFTLSFISCLYIIRANVLIIRRSKLYYTASGIITCFTVMIPEAV